MENGLGLLAAGEVDIMIHGLVKLHLFGQELYLTTTHVSVLVVCLGLVIFAAVVRSKLRDTDGKPSALQNVAEMIVESLDKMVATNMGAKGKPYRNYIGTLFIFILVSNISGLFGLRPATADYGVTLPMGLITFFIIQYNNVRYNKFGSIKSLFEPMFFFFPINLIGELAVPISLSMRLFGNILSGTVMMGVIYGLLSKFAVGWPGFLHIYFDIFSGCIQAYVFCMLTMVFTRDKMGA